MHALTQEQIDVLRSVVEQVSTKASVALGISKQDIDDFLEYFHTLYTSEPRIQQRLSSTSYILVFDHAAKDDGQPITYDQLAASVFTGQRIIHVTKSLVPVRLVAAKDNEVSAFHAGQLSDTVDSLVLFVDGLLYYPFIRGRQIVVECNIKRPGEPAHRGPTWHRSFSQLQQLLDEHMQEQLRDERAVKYWKRKKERVLAFGVDGTERIFHRALYYWLQTYVSDAIDVSAEPRGFGQNAYDIKIVLPYKKYCLEVKWLGENEHGQKYDMTQISVGLGQVLEYLDKDTEILRAYLIFYDARPREEHRTQRGYDSTAKHRLCEEPIILFLESETPSVTSKVAFGK